MGRVISLVLVTIALLLAVLFCSGRTVGAAPAIHPAHVAAQVATAPRVARPACQTVTAAERWAPIGQRHYETLCVAYVPSVPTFLDGRGAVDCDYYHESLPSYDRPAVILECRYVPDGPARMLPGTDGVLRWTYPACLYIADTDGAYTYCYLTTNDPAYNASQER